MEIIGTVGRRAKVSSDEDARAITGTADALRTIGPAES